MDLNAIESELVEAERDLNAVYSSWQFAYAMGSVCCGSEHPTHWATRASADQLRDRIVDLRALVAEHSAFR
jgi:hypothetical protein